MNHPDNARVCNCTPGRIFVFGSNRNGIHGAGAALHALKFHGAVPKRGMGYHGQSYAIPTKATPYITLSLTVIRIEVKRSLAFATTHPNLSFEVTKIGCGLAGYREDEIRPMFKGAPANCFLPEGWR